MEYSQENLSPIKIKVSVISTSQEVNENLAKIFGRYQSQIQLPGFRKGRTPQALIKKKFGKDITQESKDELINAQVKEIVQKSDFKPFSKINILAPDFPEKDRPYEWAFEFEVFPEFDLPDYENLETEEKESVIDPDDVERVVRRFRLITSKPVNIDSIAPAMDGQLANIDLDILENGQPVDAYAIKNFQYEVGNGEIIPEIEKLVKGTPVGNIAEEEIIFPEDFANSELAGKKHKVRVKINSVKGLDFSAWDQRWSGEEGQKSLAEFRELLEKDQLEEQKAFNKSVAEQKLLTQLVKQVDFPVPEVLVDLEYSRILGEMNDNLRRKGSSLAAMGEQLEKLLADAKEKAEKLAREQTLLLAVARKEGLKVSEEELAEAINNFAQANREEFQSTFNKLLQNGGIKLIEDRLLSDKAMDLIYGKAKISKIAPEKEEEKKAQE